MENQLASVWQGSKYTMLDIAHQIANRWGEEAVKEYDPQVNCFTFKGWNQRGFKVKKGEHALKTITFVGGSETVKQEDGTEKTIGRGYPKTVCLFYKTQVEKREVK